MIENENLKTIEELTTVKLGDVYFFKSVKQNGKEFFLSKLLVKNIVLKNRDKERRSGYFKIVEIVAEKDNTVIAYGERVTPLDIYPQIKLDEAKSTLKNHGFEVSEQDTGEHKILYGMLDDRESAIMTVATYSKSGRLDTFLGYIPATDEYITSGEERNLKKHFGLLAITSGYWQFDLAQSRSLRPIEKLKKLAENNTLVLNLKSDGKRNDLLYGLDFNGNKIPVEPLDEKASQFVEKHSLDI